VCALPGTTDYCVAGQMLPRWGGKPAGFDPLRGRPARAPPSTSDADLEHSRTCPPRPSRLPGSSGSQECALSRNGQGADRGRSVLSRTMDEDRLVDEDHFVDEDRFDGYDRCLVEVLDLLGLVPPPPPADDERDNRHARRNWQGRATLTIMRQARPPLPEELFEPLLRAAVYEPDPTHTQRHIKPALAAFGRRRVQTRLLEYLRTGTDYEIAGAADAWYCSWFRVAGSDADAEDDQCVDLRHEFQATGLQVFLANEDPRVRRRIISLLNLRPDENPPHLRPLVTEVLRIAHAYPDDTLVNQIRVGP
jgi:hypothetical protein